MFCKKCGENVPDDSQFCPFCAEEIKRVQVPEPPPPPAATVRMEPQQPVYQQPVAPPQPQQPVYQQPAAPPQPQYAAEPAPAKSSCSGAMVAILVVVGLLVLAVGGIGAYVVVKKLSPAPPAQTTADVGVMAPAEMPADAGGTPVIPPPMATETTTETPADVGGTPLADSPETGASSGGLDLDSYVGTWEFVGDPGPWGEGAPFSLERSGSILVGTAGLPYHEETIRLQLAAGNGELQGESTTTYPDGETEVMSLRMELDTGADLLTVSYRGADGEWRTRVAKRA